MQGTSVPPSYFYKFINSALLPAQKVQDYRNGNDPDINFSLKETLQYGGTFESFFYPKEGGALLAWLLGSDIVTGTTDPYTHTLSLAATPRFVSAEIGYGFDEDEDQIIVDRLVDGKIGSLKISGDATKPIFLTPDFIGAGADLQNAPSTVVFSDAFGEGPFTYLDGTFTLTTDDTDDAAVLSLQIVKFEIMVNLNIKPIYGFSHLTPIFLLLTIRDIGLKFTVEVPSDKLYRLTYYGSKTGTSPSRVIGRGTASLHGAIADAPNTRSFTINLPNINFTMARPNMSPAGNEFQYEVDATAVKVGSTKPVNAVVVNGQAASYITPIPPEVTITTVTDPVIDGTNDTIAAASGTCTAGSTVTVSVTDGTAVAGPFDATVISTAWSVTGMDISALADGTITYIATAVDPDSEVEAATKDATKGP